MGGPPMSATFQLPVGVAVDRFGNLVVGDYGNNEVRVVADATGTFYGVPMEAGDVYTLAGDGSRGSAGDGGPAGAAELSFPAGITVDPTGNVIFADSANNVVRVVAAATGTFYGQPMTTGDIYTIAGGGYDQLPGWHRSAGAGDERRTFGAARGGLRRREARCSSPTPPTTVSAISPPAKRFPDRLVRSPPPSGSGSATVSWVPPVRPRWSSGLGLRGDHRSEVRPLWMSVAGRRSATVSGLTNGIHYAFTVTARERPGVGSGVGELEQREGSAMTRRRSRSKRPCTESAACHPHRPATGPRGARIGPVAGAGCLHLDQRNGRHRRSTKTETLRPPDLATSSIGTRTRRWTTTSRPTTTRAS